MAAGKPWKHLEFILSENICIGTSLDILVTQNSKNIRRIDIFVHETCYPETMPMSRIVKIPCAIFKTKRSTKLKTGQQIFV